MTAFSPMSYKAASAETSVSRRVACDDFRGRTLRFVQSRKSVKPVDRLVRTEGLYSLRADDREALTNCWKTPETKLVALIGPGGIGKSSLVQLWLER